MSTIYQHETVEVPSEISTPYANQTPPDKKPADKKARKSSGIPSSVTRCFDDIKAKPIEWLWPGRIPSKGVICAGDPGQGKSQLSIAIAATVSTGGRFPDMQPCEKGSAIFIACEDDAADTIKPRLEAAGADTSKIHILDAIINSDQVEESFNLDNGIATLAGECDRLGDVRLIVIDPITAYLAGADGHKTSDVRAALAPLMNLADEYGLTVFMVSHLNKANGTDPMTRVTGSGAFVAACRAAFLIGKHPDVEDAYCMATLKTNLSADKTGIGYRVVSATSASGIETSRIEWIPGSVEVDAHRLLAPPKSEPDLDTNTAKGEAAVFLLDMVRDGPVASIEVYEAAERAGIAERTLKRAKTALHIRSIKVEGKPGWHMALPNEKPTDE